MATGRGRLARRLYGSAAGLEVGSEVAAEAAGSAAAGSEVARAAGTEEETAAKNQATVGLLTITDFIHLPIHVMI